MAQIFTASFTDELLDALGVKGNRAAGRVAVNGQVGRTVPMLRITARETTGSTKDRGLTETDVLQLLSRVRVAVTVGADKRTKTRWHVEGKAGHEAQKRGVTDIDPPLVSVE